MHKHTHTEREIWQFYYGNLKLNHIIIVNNRKRERNQQQYSSQRVIGGNQNGNFFFLLFCFQWPKKKKNFYQKKKIFFNSKTKWIIHFSTSKMNRNSGFWNFFLFNHSMIWWLIHQKSIFFLSGFCATGTKKRDNTQNNHILKLKLERKNGKKFIWKRIKKNPIELNVKHIRLEIWFVFFLSFLLVWF